jgi:hypothetical protein
VGDTEHEERKVDKVVVVKDFSICEQNIWPVTKDLQKLLE